MRLGENISPSLNTSLNVLLASFSHCRKKSGVSKYAFRRTSGRGLEAESPANLDQLGSETSHGIDDWDQGFESRDISLLAETDRSMTPSISIPCGR